MVNPWKLSLALTATLFAGAVLAVSVFAVSSGGSRLVSAQAIGGPVFVSGDDAEDHCEGTDCGGLMVAVLNSAIALSLSPGTGIAAIGMEDEGNTEALDSWNSPANGGPGVPITVITESEIPTVDFADFDVIFVPSNEGDGGEDPGINDSELATLNAREADIVNFVNDLGGGLIALTEQDADPALAFGFLPVALEFANLDYEDVEPTAALAELAPAANGTNMDHDAWHNVWTGPPGYGGLEVLATAVIPESEFDGLPAILGGAQVILQELITLTPETATNTVGEDHTVTAHVIDGVNPIEGAAVTFEVTEGANAGDGDTGTTDANGDAAFTYTGDGGPGTDTIQACFLDEQEEEHCATAGKEWVEPEATATATPSPTPAEVVQLPDTGAAPGSSSGFPWLALMVAGLIAMGAGGVWLRRARR